MEPMLHVGPAYRWRAFRPQGEAVASSILEGIHFLLDNIGILTGTATEKAGVLKCGGVNALVAIELADVSCLLLYVAPVRLLLW